MQLQTLTCDEGVSSIHRHREQGTLNFADSNASRLSWQFGRQP